MSKNEYKRQTETFGEVTLKFVVREFENNLIDCVNIYDCFNDLVGQVDTGDLDIEDITGELIDQWYLKEII